MDPLYRSPMPSSSYHQPYYHGYPHQFHSQQPIYGYPPQFQTAQPQDNPYAELGFRDEEEPEERKQHDLHLKELTFAIGRLRELGIDPRYVREAVARRFGIDVTSVKSSPSSYRISTNTIVLTKQCQSIIAEYNIENVDDSLSKPDTDVQIRADIVMKFRHPSVNETKVSPPSSPLRYFDKIRQKDRELGKLRTFVSNGNTCLSIGVSREEFPPLAHDVKQPQQTHNNTTSSRPCCCSSSSLVLAGLSSYALVEITNTLLAGRNKGKLWINMPRILSKMVQMERVITAMEARPGRAGTVQLYLLASPTFDLHDEHEDLFAEVFAKIWSDGLILGGSQVLYKDACPRLFELFEQKKLLPLPRCAAV